MQWGHSYHSWRSILTFTVVFILCLEESICGGNQKLHRDSSGWEWKQFTPHEKDLLPWELGLLGLGKCGVGAGVGVAALGSLLILGTIVLLPLLALAALTLPFALLTLLTTALLSTSSNTTPTTTLAPPTTTPPPSTINFFVNPNFDTPFSGEFPFGQCVPLPAGVTFSSIQTGGACVALYQGTTCDRTSGFFLVQGDVTNLGVFNGATQSLMIITCPS